MSTKRWSRSDLALLRREYPQRTAKEVARRLGRTVPSVYQCAIKLRLRKSAAFLASTSSGRIKRGDPRQSLSGRFQPGMAPWNKGVPWSAGGRSPLTRFKKGHRPHNQQPLGAERITKDGILQRKISDTGYPPRDWKAVHAIVWESAHGKIPRGHVVIFKPGRRTVTAALISADCLELVSRRELMRRNSYHNKYPKEIGLAIQLRGALMRQINRRTRLEDEDHGSA